MRKYQPHQNAEEIERWISSGDGDGEANKLKVVWLKGG